MQLFFCRFIYKSNFIKRPVPESCFGQNCLFLYIRVIPVSGIQTIVPVIPHYKITIFRNFIRSEASCHLFRAEAYRLCLLYIEKKVPALYLHREDWEIDKNLAGWQLKIGLPMAFQYSITAIGTIVVQSCLNILGSTAAAGFAAASKIEQVFTQAYVALGTTMATYCAQNMGAGKYTRIRKGFKSATLIGFIYAVVTGVIIFFVGKYMTIFFVSENVNQIMEYVDIYLRCVSVSFLPLVIVNLYRNGIQGMGYGLLPMTAGIAELVGRSGASLIASHFGSYMGICLASPAAWVLAGTLLLIMYFEIMKGKKDRNLKNR